MTSATGGTIRRELNSRSWLYAEASYLRTTADGTDFDRDTRRIGGGYSRQMTSRLTLNAGYDYYVSVYGDPQAGRRTIVNDVNLGVNYIWPLSFSRRTTVEFSGGTDRVTREGLGTPSVDVLRATGSATVTHLIGRTWTLQGDYNRGLQFVELFPDPFFADSVTTSIDGMLSRRVEFRATAGYADGNLQVSSSGTPGTSRTTTSATARVAYTFARAFEVAADYAYYYYDIGSAVELPVGMVPTLDRQTFRVNLRYWIPLLITR